MKAVIPYCSFGPQLETPMVPLFEPDNGNGFGLRYLWITHREDNERFIGNYFSNGNTGINIRKQTTQFQEYWDYHNQVFINSAQDGNLIWRVKALNNISKSIDYIEIWKSKQTVIDFFGPDAVFPGNKIFVPSVPGWINRTANLLGQGLYDAGFLVKNWYPVQTVSFEQARTLYEHFCSESLNKNNYLINTPWQNIQSGSYQLPPILKDFPN